MLHNPRQSPHKPGQPVGLLLAGLFFVNLLACGGGWAPWLFRPTPTLEPLVIGVVVQGPGPVADDPPATTPSQPISGPSGSATPGPVVIPTDTPPPEPAAPPITPILATAPGPAPTPGGPAAPPPAGGEPAAVLPGPEAAGNIHTGPLSDQIQLLDPQPGFTLPEGRDQLEFKWQWHGAGPRACQLTEGYGFDLRIWPAPFHPHLAPEVTVVPQGVIDAVKDQALITNACDPKTDMRRLVVSGLQSSPGVRTAGGFGQFFWDVAYVQLDPFYQVVSVSAPRDFFIPAPPGSTPIPTATPSPIPVFVAEPAPRPVGDVTLLAPASGQTFPANVDRMEFKWQWDGPVDANLCQPSPTYGFELRLGPLGAAPLGVMDAVVDQHRIGCDPAAGVFYYTVADLKETPGVKAAVAGDSAWTGRFQWDVALVSLNPYVPPDSAAPPHTFEISLTDYTGPLDPNGEPLTCSQFSSWLEAQAIFLAAGGPGRDFHKLDPDGNGLACDGLRE
jgi:hypothetical protein